MTPEQQARQEIDRLLKSAGWHVCGVSDVNIHAARGVAIREFALDAGHGYEYTPEELDRGVQTPDQIRTIARTLRDTVRDLLRTRQLAIEQRTVVLRALSRLGDSSGELADALISEGTAAVGCARTVTFDSPPYYQR